MGEVQAFGFREGAAETVFDDGLRLRVVPAGDADPIEIASCVLSTEDGTLAVTSRDGYWSESVAQTDFAERLGKAVEAERQVYKAYRMKRIEEQVWQDQFRMFWKVMIRCRPLLGRLTAGAVREVASPDELAIKG